MERVRHSNIPLEELMKKIQTLNELTATHHRSIGMFEVSEVGAMAHHGDLEAEAFLCKILLCHKSLTLQATSYASLKTLSSPQEDTKKVLAKFEADPENTHFIKFVMESMEEEED